MQETIGLLERIKHHDKLPISVNENCAIPLPEDIIESLFKPHRLSFYYFMYLERGTANFRADLQDISITGGQLVFGVPNQIFTNMPFNRDEQHYTVSFDENALSLLPDSFPFLLNQHHTNIVTFDEEAQIRVKGLFSFLFQLLHASRKPKKPELILAHLNALLTEINSAYFEQYHHEVIPNGRLSKYLAFKLAVDTHLTEQHDVQAIAEKLAVTTSNLYGIVKEHSGISPKEWITNRLMLEAQRRLQYSSVSVKELAYDLGFNDPAYFSRLFKKSTGKTVSSYLDSLNDLS